MKKLFLLLICFGGALGLGAQEVRLTIVDQDLGTPLDGAKIIQEDGSILVADQEGVVSLPWPSGRLKWRVAVQFPGYEPRRLTITGAQKTVLIQLAIAGAVQGKELVVEKNRPRSTDAQSGVSQVVTRDEIRSTAEIGIVEDVLSAIKVLPGVGYSGGWNAMPSIRGGDPRETSSVLDGAPVLYPYHWGGAFSIFNPDMVESAKLSNGLISARYGQVLSGLLEITSKTPSFSQTQVAAAISTTGADLFLQTPLGEAAGLLAGGKVTWMEVSFAMVGQASHFEKVPYIRDGYAKIFWKPSPQLSWFANLFYGTDGIRTIDEAQDESKSLTTKGHFGWDNTAIVASTNLKALLFDNLLSEVSFAYNRVVNAMDYEQLTNGTKAYDQAFIDANKPLLDSVSPGATGFTLNNLSNGLSTNALAESFVARLNLDLQLSRDQSLTLGTDENLTVMNDSEQPHFWVDDFTSGTPVFKLYNRSIEVKSNRTMLSALYGIYNFDWGSGLVSGEAGVRVDHAYFFNDGFSLQTLPTVNPRVRLAYSPIKNLGGIQKISLTGGSGVYSQNSMIGNLFDPKYGMKDFEFGPDRAWFNVLGTEILGEDGWKVSLEGYFKQYFNRLIVFPENQTYVARTDGTGYAWGLDLLVQKQSGRNWDGWLTYSFSLARFQNPAGKTVAQQMRTIDGSPLNTEYFPRYHRFHSLNLILNWKPLDGFAVTLKASLATGAPKKALGAVVSYGTVDGAQVIERFAQTSSYDDNLRNDLSCPVDLKMTWSGYFPASKVRYEFYAGAENVFANLYSPATNKAIDPYTGGQIADSGQADFGIGFPIPSFGVKFSY